MGTTEEGYLAHGDYVLRKSMPENCGDGFKPEKIFSHNELLPVLDSISQNVNPIQDASQKEKKTRGCKKD